MKQMPPYQPLGNAMQWVPYQQATQPIQAAGTLANPDSSTGLLGLLKKINPLSGNLSKTLDQIQNFLQMSQSITPKLQEYGPMIKNLPSMLALMKEFNESEDDEQTGNPEETVEDSTDVLDEILGLNPEETTNESDIKSKLSKDIDEANQTNLFKIETMEDRVKPIYKEPMLFV